MELVVGKTVNREDIGEFDFGFQSELNVIAEQKLVADGDQVTRHTVVISRHTFGGNQTRFDIAKDLRPFFVQLGKTRTQVRRRIAKPIAKHLISSGSKLCVGHR